jgi:hypothetical protein
MQSLPHLVVQTLAHREEHLEVQAELREEPREAREEEEAQASTST